MTVTSLPSVRKFCFLGLLASPNETHSINRWIWSSVYGSTETFILKISWIVTNNFFPLLYMFLVPEVTLIHICSNCDIIHAPKHSPAPPIVNAHLNFSFCYFCLYLRKFFMNHKCLSVLVQLCNYFWSVHDLVSIIFLLAWCNFI